MQIPYEQSSGLGCSLRQLKIHTLTHLSIIYLFILLGLTVFYFTVTIYPYLSFNTHVTNDNIPSNKMSINPNMEGKLPHYET